MYWWLGKNDNSTWKTQEMKLLDGRNTALIATYDSNAEASSSFLVLHLFLLFTTIESVCMFIDRDW